MLFERFVSSSEKQEIWKPDVDLFNILSFVYTTSKSTDNNFE